MSADGVIYAATVRLPDGTCLRRETADRVEVLAWIALHVPPGRLDLLITEARGEAADRLMRSMRATLRPVTG